MAALPLFIFAPLSFDPERQYFMGAKTNNESVAACQDAKRRLISEDGGPILVAAWESAMFLHFCVPPETLRPEVPRPFELELHDGVACVSLVAVTMSRFRPCRRISPAWFFRHISQQRFLNFRTYVRYSDEPGAFFLWGWLSQPFLIGLPSSLFGLPYSFASVEYQHQVRKNVFSGNVSEAAGSGRFLFRADIPAAFHPCSSGSLDEFALERYTGYYYYRAKRRLFRTWHPPWRQVPVQPQIQDMSLISERFPWFTKAQLAGANFSPGFSEVSLGSPHRLAKRPSPTGQGRRILSAFYELP